MCSNLIRLFTGYDNYNTDGTANNKPVYEGTNGGYYYYTDTYNKVPIPQNRKMFITFL